MKYDKKFILAIFLIAGTSRGWINPQEAVSGPFIPRGPDQLGARTNIPRIPPFFPGQKEKAEQQQQQVLKEVRGIVQKEVGKGVKEAVEATSGAAVSAPVVSAAATSVPAASASKLTVVKKGDTQAVDWQTTDILKNIFDDNELAGKRISFLTKPAPVVDVLELVRRRAGLDMVIDSDVNGTTQKISCVDCTVGDILELVLSTNTPRLALIKFGNVWRIMLYEKAVEFIDKKQKEDYVSKVINVYNAKFDTDFIAQVQKMWDSITQDAKGLHKYITFNMACRKIFVHSSSYHIRQIEAFLKEIDHVVPQVRIDVVFVNAQKTYSYHLGFNWSGVYNRESTLKLHGTSFGLAGIGASTLEYPKPQAGYSITSGEPLKNTNLLIDPLNFALNFVKDTAESLIKIPFIFGGPDLNTRRLNLVLNVLEQENKLKIIARPSVLTNDRELADMLIGSSIPLQTIVQDTKEGVLRTVTTTDFKDIGTSIKVRPTVNLDKNTILLDVFIQDTELSGALGHSSSQGGTLTEPPIIVTVRTQNKILLRSGQTTVIGGLVRQSHQKTITILPILHKIPFIGRFFRGKEEIKRDEEQLIFITPTLIENDL